MVSLLLCLGFVHSASAAILFYKQNLTVSITGNARVMTRTFGGFTLIDSATGDLVFVSTDVKSKRFKVEQPDHKLTAVQPSASGYRTILQILSGAGEGLNARGVNNWLNVGATQPVSSPSTFAVGGCDAYVPSGLTTPYAFEYRGAVVYDKADTVDATKNGLTLAGGTDKVRQILINKGYTED
jgi:hypothetical protein